MAVRNVTSAILLLCCRAQGNRMEIPAITEISSVCQGLRLLGGVIAPLPPTRLRFFKRSQNFKNSPLTLMCFDHSSPSLSPAHLEKPQPQPIIYLLWRFHVSEMFSHKCTYCAPVSQLFMLWLCHSSMSSHAFQQRGKNERERDGERQ